MALPIVRETVRETVRGPQVLAAIREGTVHSPGDQALLVKREGTAKALTAVLEFHPTAEKAIFILTGAEEFAEL